MKNLIILLLIFAGGFSSYAGDSIPDSKIVFFREDNYQGSAISFRISVNDSMVVKLRNKSYYEYACAAGKYKISMDNFGGSYINLDIEEGESYYVRFGIRTGVWTTTPDIVVVDSAYAHKAVYQAELINLNAGLASFQRPKSRIGLELRMGVGLERIPLITMENGEMSDLSFGGGFSVGATYGYEVSKYFDLALGFKYQSGGLMPYLENASMNFSRIILSGTPSLIIPIDGGYSMRFKLGAGLKNYMAPKLKIETSEVPGGINDTWKYKNSLGYHLRLLFEMNPSDEFSMMYGIEYYDTNYEYDVSERYSYPTSDELGQPDGAGVDFLFGIFYHF